MMSFEKWIEHGIAHLTLQFVFAVFGVELFVSTAATWTVHLVQKLIFSGVEPPPHFYVVLGILIFCALSLFAIMISMLHRMAIDKPAIPIPPLPIPSKLVIHSAFYGNTPENEVSVLPKLNSLPKDAFAIYVTNNNVDAEPAPGIPPKKRLRVRYSYGNETVFETSREESEWMVLPDPTDRERIIS